MAFGEVDGQVSLMIDSLFDEHQAYADLAVPDRSKFRDELRAHAFSSFVSRFNLEMTTVHDVWVMWDMLRGKPENLESGGLRGPRRGNGQVTFPVLRPVWRDYKRRFEPVLPNARRLGCKEPELSVFGWRLGQLQPDELTETARAALLLHPVLKGVLASEKTATASARHSQSLS